MIITMLELMKSLLNKGFYTFFESHAQELYVLIEPCLNCADLEARDLFLKFLADITRKYDPVDSR